MENSYQKKISKEALNDLPLGEFPGEIVCIRKAEDVYPAIAEMKNERVIGFDTETKPNFKRGQRNGIALLQLSSPEKAFLFKIKKTGMPDALIDFLSDERIIKPGVAIHDDLKGLKKIRQFTPGGFVELQKLSRQYGIENNGLRKLTGIVLNFRISKSEQLSNWEQNTLSKRQMLYAATDAWTSCLIYRSLVYSEKFEF